QEVRRHMPVVNVHLYLRDETQPVLRPFSDTAPLPEYPIHHGILGGVVASGEAVFTNNITDHPDYDENLDMLVSTGPVPLAAGPLKVKSEVVGVLVLHNRADTIFSEEDAALLRAFANPVATAVE